MKKTKITGKLLHELGFKHVPSLIQESYMLVLVDQTFTPDFPGATNLHHFKALSLSLCNDKGKGEYYAFLREGSSPDRNKDDVITLTRNMEYEEDLRELIRLLQL
jgi:hypothetical protein